MSDLLRKEMRLSASVLSFLFIAFGLLAFVPGYPILCGGFFITLGIFQSFRNMAETNDIVYSVLLPVAKRDVVKGKFLFVCLIEAGGFLAAAVPTLLRMTALADALPYRNNALMNANLFFLGLLLLLFGVFNTVFVGGFFKTAYRVGKPFVVYIAAAFLLITAGEALHYFPGLEALNAFGTEHLTLQHILLFAGALLYGVLTPAAYRVSADRFEKIDL